MRQVEGRRPVLELLEGGHDVVEVLIASGTKRSGALGRIREIAERRGVRVSVLGRDELEARAQTPAAQGVIALTEAFAYRRLSDVLSSIEGVPLLVALDGLTDPHNVGAIARSAEAAGADGLILPSRRSAPVTPVVEKAAAGALAHLPVAKVSNLGRALSELKEAGIWIAALDADGEQEVFDVGLATEPLCVVVGSEGAGVSRLVRERADVRIAIPMAGHVGSLNASTAAAVLLFEVVRQRSGS